MPTFLRVAGILFICSLPIFPTISSISAGILFIALASIIEHQQTLIRKNDLIIHQLQLHQSLYVEDDDEPYNEQDTE